MIDFKTIKKRIDRTNNEHKTCKVNLYTSEYSKLDKSLYRCEVAINVIKEEIILEEEKVENNNFYEWVLEK